MRWGKKSLAPFLFSTLLLAVGVMPKVAMARDGRERTGLRGDRQAFLRRQFETGLPVGRELVRQHLYDAEPAVRALALKLLDGVQDTPTLLVGLTD